VRAVGTTVATAIAPLPGPGAVRSAQVAQDVLPPAIFGAISAAVSGEAAPLLSAALPGRAVARRGAALRLGRPFSLFRLRILRPVSRLVHLAVAVVVQIVAGRLGPVR